jgi:ArsR family transcriptional regulator
LVGCEQHLNSQPDGMMFYCTEGGGSDKRKAQLWSGSSRKQAVEPMSGLTCCECDDFIKAMANETRQRILALLREREMSVSELNEHFAITQPTLSHHLALLRRANLVSLRHEGRQTFYRVNLACGIEGCREILARFNIPVAQQRDDHTLTERNEAEATSEAGVG